MYKTIFYTVIITTIICGILWFSLGRNNTADIERAVNRANGDFQIIERDLRSFESGFDGYIGRVSGSIEKANRVRNEVGELRDEAGEHVGTLGSIKSGLDSIHARIIDVEDRVREGLIWSRDLGDVAYWYRRGSEEDEKKD